MNYFSRILETLRTLVSRKGTREQTASPSRVRIQRRVDCRITVFCLCEGASLSGVMRGLSLERLVLTLPHPVPVGWIVTVCRSAEEAHQGLRARVSWCRAIIGTPDYEIRVRLIEPEAVVYRSWVKQIMVARECSDSRPGWSPGRDEERQGSDRDVA